MGAVGPPPQAETVNAPEITIERILMFRSSFLMGCQPISWLSRSDCRARMEIVQPSDRFSDEVSPYVDMKRAWKTREKERQLAHMARLLPLPIGLESRRSCIVNWTLDHVDRP